MEAEKEELELPDECPREIGAFISWAYTGQVIGSFSLLKQWVLADKLRAPGFANEVMNSLFSLYGSHDGRGMTADEGQFVYDHTHKNSKLRLFIKEFLTNDRPLCQNRTLFGLRETEKGRMTTRRLNTNRTGES